jgi:hypothetical protein
MSVPPSLNGAKLLWQNEAPPKPWSIYAMGNAVILYYDAECAPCIQYVQHLFHYMGTFGLPLEWVQEVVGKAWPHLVESIKREAERPLKEKLTSLKHYIQKEVDRLDELNSDHEDLWIR